MPIIGLRKSKQMMDQDCGRVRQIMTSRLTLVLVTDCSLISGTFGLTGENRRTVVSAEVAGSEALGARVAGRLKNIDGGTELDQFTEKH